VYLAVQEQDIVDENYAETDSDEDNNDNNEDADWKGKLPADRAQVHTFIGEQNGLDKEAAPDITNEATPGDYFMLFFCTVLPIILLQTNHYMDQVFAAKDKTLRRLREILMKDMFAFFTLVIQMGHHHKPSLRSYWSKDELYCIPFYSNVLSRDWFLTVLKYLHFANNENPPTENRDDPKYDRLWKIRQIFDLLNSKFCELYFPSEQMSVDEVIVKYKDKVIFRQYIPRKHKRFGIKLYKLCDRSGYTFDMNIQGTVK
jgi:hypothetical protein